MCQTIIKTSYCENFQSLKLVFGRVFLLYSPSCVALPLPAAEPTSAGSTRAPVGGPGGPESPGGPGSPGSPGGPGGTVVHRLIRALPLTGSLADIPGRRPSPVWTDRVGVATSAGVQFRLEPSFSVDESSSESSNMRSLLCCCCGF